MLANCNCYLIATEGLAPLIFAVCFGVAAVAVAASICLVYFTVRLGRGVGIPPLQLRTCLLPSMLSGVVWSIGNVGGVLATQKPLGLTVGYPVTQSCLLIAGLCGIFIYGEVCMCM